MSLKFSQRNSEYFQSFNPQKSKVQQEQVMLNLRKKKRSMHTNSKRALSDANRGSEIYFPADIIPDFFSSEWPILIDSKIPAFDRVKYFLQLIVSCTDLDTLKLLLDSLQRLFSKNSNMPYDNLFSDSIVLVFVSLLHHEDLEVKRVLLLCLINVFNNGKNTIKKFVESQVIEILADMIKNIKNLRVLDNAVWALGNLIGECKEYKEISVSLDILPYLVSFFTMKDPDLIKTTVWVLSNLCKVSDLFDKETVEMILKGLFNGLKQTDVKAISDSLWCIERITSKGSQNCSIVIKSGFVHVLLDYLKSMSSEILSPALKIIQNFIYFNDNNVELLLTVGLSSILYHLLDSKNTSVKKEVLFTFSNIFSSREDFILQVLKDHNFKKILEYVDSQIFSLKREAIYIICNGLSKRHVIITDLLMKYGCLGKLVDLLRSKESNLLMAILKSLRIMFDLLSDVMDNDRWDNFVKEFADLGGIDALENLQLHKNEKIFAEAKSFIEEFIGVDEQVSNMPVNNFSFS